MDISNIAFKEALTPPSIAEWSRGGNTSLVDGAMQLNKNGIITYKRVVSSATSDTVPAVAKYYRVTVTFNEAVSSHIFLAMHVNRVAPSKDAEKPEDTHVVVPIYPRQNEVNKVVRYFEANGGSVDTFLFEVYNLNDSRVIISSVSVDPSYDLDEATLEEVDRLIPAIQKYENANDTIYVNDTDTTLVNMDVEAASETNLQVHFMLNFENKSDNNVMTLTFLFNEGVLPYSPLQVTLINGWNIVGLPLSIMEVPTGINKLKILAKTSNGGVYIERYKVQLTLDGKNLMSKSSSKAPEVNTQVYIEKPAISLEEHPITMNAFAAFQEVIPVGVAQHIALTKSKKHQVTAVCNFSFIRRSEDIYFDSQDFGKDYFDHTNVVTISDGSMHLKPASAAVTYMTHIATGLQGDMFECTVDNTQVQNYSQFDVSPSTVSLISKPVNLYNAIITSNEYVCTDEGISQVIEYEHRIPLLDVYEDRVTAIVEFDENDYREYDSIIVKEVY